MERKPAKTDNRPPGSQKNTYTDAGKQIRRGYNGYYTNLDYRSTEQVSGNDYGRHVSTGFLTYKQKNYDVLK